MNKIIQRECPACFTPAPFPPTWVETVEKVERIMCPECDTIYFDREPPEKPKYDMKYNLHFFRPGDIMKAGIMATKLAKLIEGKWKNTNILEAGSGNGLTVLLLRAMGYNAFGVDLDPALSVHLMEKFRTPIITANFEEFNPPGKYHLVYSSHVIEHCFRPRRFFQKAASILETGGIFYLDTPDTYFYERGPKRWHHFATRNPYEHCCLLGRKGLKALANAEGLEVAEIGRYSDFGSQQAVLIKLREKVAPGPGNTALRRN